MPYSHFSTDEFATDEYFIRWVKNPDPSCDAFWQAWISSHPQQKDSIRQAREIVLMLDIKVRRPPEGKFLEVWEKINEDITQERFDEKPLELDGTRKRYWFTNVAAAAILLSISLWAYARYEKNRPINIVTNYGESRTLFLPDSTKVTLNGNSSIQYIRRDFEKNNRKVNLTGQAFFSVTHTIDHQNFKVYTNELQVEVLGTRFDVNSRRGKTKVVLQEGKVRLDMDRNNEDGSTVVMHPGEIAEVTSQSETINVRKVNVDSYVAWRNNRMEFSAISLQEIAQMLEDNDGYRVTFKDEELKQRRFTGLSEDIPDLLEKLSLIFDMNTTLNGKEITFESK